MDRFAKLSPYFALVVACVAMGGSLFFSDVLGWLPCTLCWYQRICMYPLTVILSVGILRRDKDVRLYVLPLSIVGAVIALYHYLEQKTDLFLPFPCQAGISCKADYLNAFGGVVTIPFLALIAFLLITFFMVASRLAVSDIGEDEDEAGADAVPSADAQTNAGPSPALPVAAIIGVVALLYFFLGNFLKG